MLKVVKCAKIAGPCFTKDQFHGHLMLEAERINLIGIICALNIRKTQNRQIEKLEIRNREIREGNRQIKTHNGEIRNHEIKKSEMEIAIKEGTTYQNEMRSCWSEVGGRRCWSEKKKSMAAALNGTNEKKVAHCVGWKKEKPNILPRR